MDDQTNKKATKKRKADASSADGDSGRATGDGKKGLSSGGSKSKPATKTKKAATARPTSQRRKPRAAAAAAKAALTESADADDGAKVSVKKKPKKLTKEEARIQYDRIIKSVLRCLDPAKAKKIEQAAKEDIKRRTDLSRALLSAPAVLTSTVKKHSGPANDVWDMIMSGNNEGAMDFVQNDAAYRRLYGDGATVDTALHFGEDLRKDVFVGNNVPYLGSLNAQNQAVAKFYEEFGNTPGLPVSRVYVKKLVAALKKAGPASRYYFVTIQTQLKFLDSDDATENKIYSVLNSMTQYR